jgi:ribonuclease HI
MTPSNTRLYPNTLILYCDGGVRSKGKAISYGSFKAYDRGVLLHHQKITFLHTANATSAEYQSLIACLKWLHPQYNSQATYLIYFDNASIVLQLKGEAICHRNYLKPLHQQACELLAEMPTVQLEWVPRSEIYLELGH